MFSATKRYMRKAIVLVALGWASAHVQAQTFSNTAGGPIAEVNISNLFPIEVSGLPPAIDSVTFGLVRVCFNIAHTFTGDLDIKLQSPDGTVLIIASNFGGSGDNYEGTCVSEDAADGELAEATPPFTGTFYPHQSINKLNNGQNPNGVWYLIVIDEVPYDTGHVQSVSLIFDVNPPPTHVGGPCTVNDASGCECEDGSNDCDLLPNMINSEKYISLNWTEKVGFIRLGVATPNIGYGPLEMHGTGTCYCDTVLVNCNSTCPDGNSPKEKVNQTIYHKSDAVMSTYNIPSGTMTYHPTHGHIHIDDWTHNSLRIPGLDPNPATWPIVAQSNKLSFCLVNLGTCTSGNGYCVDADGQVRHKDNIPNFGLGFYTGCAFDQGIYVGRYDAYQQYLDGQEIVFDSTMCNGKYYIVSITDPTNIVKESNEDDNAAKVLITLKKQAQNCCKASFHADTTQGPAPLFVQFVHSSVPIADSVLWDFGDGTLSADPFPLHVYTMPGIYTVRLITFHSTGCIDTLVKPDYVLVDFAVAAPVVGDPISMDLHCTPNPFQKGCTVSLFIPDAMPVHIYITDLAGAVVAGLGSGYRRAGWHKIEIDGQRLPPGEGMFLLHAEVLGLRKTVKLVRHL